jgi:CDP-diacylglycerol--glycerol-3-phosphate 3-phosphatidyltransferase/cardiolipin synthase
MKFKFPNYLTIGRISIAPVFVFTFYLPGFYGDVIPFALFVIASFIDFLDGLLARMYKEESKLGELLDPIADKIIVATALILLVMNGTIKNYEVIAAIIILPAVINSFLFLSSVKKIVEHRQIKNPTSHTPDWKLKSTLEKHAPITLVRLLIAQKPLSEKQIATEIFKLAIFSGILGIITAFFMEVKLS